MIQINRKGNQKIYLDGHYLELTNLSKVFWPEEGITKGELLQYYSDISHYILPYLADRPESLNRYPNGIHEKSFYQKDMNSQIPEWLPTVKIKSESHGTINYLLCQDETSLLFATNLGCIDLNPWNSRIATLDSPDYLLIDLDPLDVSFDYVVKAANAVHEVLENLEIPNYPKTSGATGIHIYIPVGAKYSYEQVRTFAQILVNLTHREAPNYTSVERKPSNRENRVYLDYLQNAKGQTLAAPYSVRPRPGAPISTPLHWSEVKKGLKPTDFNMKNIRQRLEQLGDIFKPVLGKGIDINEILKKVEYRVKDY